MTYKKVKPKNKVEPLVYETTSCYDCALSVANEADYICMHPEMSGNRAILEPELFGAREHRIIPARCPLRKRMMLISIPLTEMN